MKHTHSAGGVVVNNLGLVIVVSQRGKSWSLPKGHRQKEEDILETAKREIFEETGIAELELIKKLGSYQRYQMKDGQEDRTELKTIHMFLFKTSEKILTPQDLDNPEARWVDKDDVISLLTYDKDKEFFLSVINEF